MPRLDALGVPVQARHVRNLFLDRVADEGFDSVGLHDWCDMSPLDFICKDGHLLVMAAIKCQGPTPFWGVLCGDSVKLRLMAVKLSDLLE